MASSNNRSRHRSARLAANRLIDFQYFHTTGWHRSNMDSQGVVGQSVEEEATSVGVEQSEQVSLGGEIMGDNVDNMMEGTGPMHGGTSSQGALPVRAHLGPSSDSTISNPDLSQGNVGPDVWQVQKVQLFVKLQRAKEREKALKAQISAQCKRIRLEVQERENQRLESDLIHCEQERLAADRECARADQLLAKRNKLSELAKENEHEFALHQQRLMADFQEHTSQLEHEIKLRELEIEQQKREAELNLKLQEINSRRGQGEGPGTSRNDGNVGNWLEQMGQESNVPREVRNVNRDPNNPAYANVTGGLAASGATLVTEMGLDQNTTQFITAQAVRARKSMSRGTSAQRDTAFDPICTYRAERTWQRHVGHPRRHAWTINGGKDEQY